MLFKARKINVYSQKVVNIHLVYQINILLFSVGKDFPLGNSLLSAVELTADPDSNKHKYSGNAIAFDTHGSFLL